MNKLTLTLSCIICLICSTPKRLSSQNPGSPVGTFENHADIGTVLHPGFVEYDDSKHAYTITGSGENLWGTADAFHYVWKKVSGDVSLTARITFPDTVGDPHKKAVLMIRQSLDMDAAYADIAVHGNGLTSLQSRDEKGVATHEIQSNISAPEQVRLEKRGADFYMLLARTGDKLQMAGGSMRVQLTEPFYIGIGVCAHNKDEIQKARFADVEVAEVPFASMRPVEYSTLETVTVASTDRRVTYVADRINSAIWTRDGKSLLFTRRGKIQSVPVEGGEPKTLETGLASGNHSHHAISPDGTMLAFTGYSESTRDSSIYIVPISGGTPRRITQNTPSYLGGWSPDGKTLVFTGERDSTEKQFGRLDIYTISAAADAEEKRLTPAQTLSGSPEFSPDGKYIYFESNRSGHLQIWRMQTDGSEAEQVTSDDFNNEHPHPSPDGRRIAFISYERSDPLGPSPANKYEMLRVMMLADRSIRVIAKFVGRGLDVPPWSPDGRKLAFVSHQYVK